ncbi:MAG: hypothetical protein KF851_08185 [Pirellulaceae bacterium]|jgi:hypothetical protein|nr:hypothetical protein [Pirellulaceae bacterium]
MPGTYQKHGVHILYPENWKLEDSESGEVPFEIWLESPDGALLSMTFFAPESDMADVLKEYIAGFQEQYEDLELTPAEDEVSGFVGHGNDSMFYCLDFLVTCKLRLYSTPKYLVAILEQAEAREFDKMAQVFLAIKTKMLEGLK